MLVGRHQGAGESWGGHQVTHICERDPRDSRNVKGNRTPRNRVVLWQSSCGSCFSPASKIIANVRSLIHISWMNVRCKIQRHSHSFSK